MYNVLEISVQNLIVNRKLCLVSSYTTLLLFLGTNKNPPFKSKLTTQIEVPALHILFAFSMVRFLVHTFWENTDSSTPHEKVACFTHWLRHLLIPLVLFDTFWYFWRTNKKLNTHSDTPSERRFFFCTF